MNKTAIEYTHKSSNPIAKVGGGHYCVKVSEGCKFCYAEAHDRRKLYGQVPTPYKAMKTPPELELLKNVLDSWKRVKIPQRIMLSTMTDIFGEFVKPDWTFQILDAMIAAPIPTFLCFTKREVLMEERIDFFCNSRGIEKLP